MIKFISLFNIILFSSFNFSFACEVDSGTEKLSECNFVNENVIRYSLVEMDNEFGNYLNIEKEISGEASQDKLRWVMISDIHVRNGKIGYSPNVVMPVSEFVEYLPEGNVLVIAGDLLGSGALNELKDFRYFIDSVSSSRRYQYIVVVPGNHDRILDKDHFLNVGHALVGQTEFAESEYDRGQSILRDNLPPSVIYLLDESAVIEGYRIYGTPWVVGMKTWAFSTLCEQELSTQWAKIPENTDILVSHMPPYLHGDLEGAVIRRGEKAYFHEGSKSLLDQSLHVHPFLHIFGHVHEGYGITQRRGHKTWFINASTCNEKYEPVQAPIVIDIPKKVP